MLLYTCQMYPELGYVLPPERRATTEDNVSAIRKGKQDNRPTEPHEISGAPKTADTSQKQLGDPPSTSTGRTTGPVAENLNSMAASTGTTTNRDKDLPASPIDE